MINPNTPIPDLIPETQVSTQQVPCGPHSIFDTTANVTEFERATYLIVNERSNWLSGITHALSYTRLTELINVEHRSQVIRAIKSLIEKGWLAIHNRRRSDGANIYKVTHHNCKPEDVPLDKDGHPMKCAVPRAEGSASQLVADGKLDWRSMVQWFVKKINSDWTTGIVEMTVRKCNDLVRFSIDTICRNTRKLIEVGLLNRLTPKNHSPEYQLYPQPYPEKRERNHKDRKRPLPLIGKWYYSYNRKWRFSKDSFLLQKQESGTWQDTSMYELERINHHIHTDFTAYMHHIRLANSLNSEFEFEPQGAN